MRTVQAVLEEALAKLHGSHVTLYGSGRTDSGVHALSQAANFFSPIDSIPIEKYPLIINNMLPPDVRVMSAACTDEKFNARYSATSKVYRYCMFALGTPPVHLVRYVWPLFRIIIAMAVLGVILYELFDVAERRLTCWRRPA